MITTSYGTFSSWQDFFENKLLKNVQFKLESSFSKGHTSIQVFRQVRFNKETIVEIGYFSNGDLIYLSIQNPDTPGFNKQQRNEIFYKYDFSHDKDNGPTGGPGLEFNLINVEGLNQYLSKGLKGKERLYYERDKVVKSEVTVLYDTAPGQAFTLTYYFNRNSLFHRILEKIMMKKKTYTIKDVDLESVFGGIS